MSKFLKIFLLTSYIFLMIYLHQMLNAISGTQQQIMGDQIEKRLGQLENEVRNNVLDKKPDKGVNSYINTSDVGGNDVTDAHLLPNERNTKIVDAPGIKYILQWHDSETVPFAYMGKGQQGFVERNCEYINCFVTDNRFHLGDVTKFDVIAFTGPQLLQKYIQLPQHRSPLQKYVFASIESADNYPACNKQLDNFFNWTWTYKLDSDSKWGYIVVRDSKGNIIGPKRDMNWIDKDDMAPVSDEVMVKLRNKKKAAAWFVSNCQTRSEREYFIKDLNKALNAHNLGVDIFGKCGNLDCKRDRQAECGKMLERDYYFYLSFENSFAEDYVTEKLMHGLKNYAVPIVYGGANYSRFMPDGMYLNAEKLGVYLLSKVMKYLIDNPERYTEYFRWRNHYTFHTRSESVETDDYCGFCKLLNNEDLVRKTTIYKEFSKWWTPPKRCL